MDPHRQLVHDSWPGRVKERIAVFIAPTIHAPPLHAANCKVRAVTNCDPAAVVALYDQWSQLKASADALRAERNANAASMKGKLPQEERDRLIAEGKVLKDKVAALEMRRA